MTDPTTPSDDDLSLALDGEADAELLARFEASPAAQARLEELRAAASLAGTPVAPLDDDTVDQLIAAALDTPVAPPRVATAGRRRAAPWLVAASVAVLMAAGLSLVWAGRSSDDDQAAATKTSAEVQKADDGAADSSFSESGASTGSNENADPAAPLAGGHGSPTTVVPFAGVDLPVVYLGSFRSADRLREATATSFAEALASSDSALGYNPDDPDDRQASTTGAMPKAPAAKSVDRCAEQLQVTLSLKAGPLQTGYATVDDKSVLVYEFAAASAKDGKETTLVAAVGTESCDAVVLFER